MFVTEIDTDKYKQTILFSKDNKARYGEINTPFWLIEKMLNILPETVFSNPNLKWLDPCCGCGYFMIILFKRLYNGLKQQIPDEKQREKHIIENMIFMIEVNHENKDRLFNLFGENANIFIYDFLSNVENLIEDKMEKKCESYKNIVEFDIIIGNPPYNSYGNIKVPTNKNSKKIEDGKSIWRDFTKKAVSLLKCGGYLNFIIPSIWMKPDRFHMYNFMTQYKIDKMHCFSNTETNQIFKGEAQTPTCYFLLCKEFAKSDAINENDDTKIITLFDKDQEKYIDFNLLPHYPIPVFGCSVIQKLIPFIQKFGFIQAIKTNEPSQNLEFNPERTEKYKYPCILSATFRKQEPVELSLKTNYCSESPPYYGESKLILAHKMFGFPLLDVQGKWGISRRDNYIILDKSNINLTKIQQFLSTYFALYVFEATRYRMKYLEKYAFQFLPDITKITDFPDIINDTTIAEYFGFSLQEKKAIMTLHNKKYF